MSEIIKKDGFPYSFEPAACSTCAGNCCIGESGYIWITKQECEKLAEHLKITLDELGQKYLMKVGYKYSIRENKLDENNFACIFFNLEKKQCSIYEARPLQCRTFPFGTILKQESMR